MSRRPKIAPLWGHPAIAGHHLVRMTRDYPDGRSFNVGTCQCGWSVRAEVSRDNTFACDNAVEAHWRGVIAASGETAS